MSSTYIREKVKYIDLLELEKKIHDLYLDYYSKYKLMESNL